MSYYCNCPADAESAQASPAGGEPEPIRPGRLFPADPGALGYWLRVAAVQLAWPVLLVWAAGPATWLGRKVWRGAAALTAREVGARLRVVTLPAFLGPAQVLLFGPWTVHATNRAEFLGTSERHQSITRLISRRSTVSNCDPWARQKATFNHGLLGQSITQLCELYPGNVQHDL